MSARIAPSTRSAGFWSAICATLFAALYIVAQIAEWAGLLGSAGGPESSSTPVGLVVLLTPSLVLGSAFLVLMASVHRAASPDKSVWSLAALGFAIAYATLTGLVYYAQLTFVAPRIAAGAVEGAEPFLFVPFDSFLYSVDLLGYSFMSLATLFASRVFEGATKWWLTANGLLLPFLALQIQFHPLIWIATLWAVTFPGSTIALALWFRRAPVSP